MNNVIPVVIGRNVRFTMNNIRTWSLIGLMRIAFRLLIL